MAKKTEGIEVSLRFVADILNGNTRWHSEKETKRRRNELLEDLIPILAPRLKDDQPPNYYWEKLIKKINNMRLISYWKVDLSNPKAGIVKRTFPGAEGSPRKMAYATIATALEESKLSRLRSCFGCEKWFVASDFKQKHCNPECTSAYHRKSAKYRVRKMRLKNKTMSIPDQDKAKKLKELRQFDLFLKKAGGRIKTQMEVGPYIKRNIPGGWNTVIKWQEEKHRGKSTKLIWKTLPNQIKATLRDSWTRT